MPAYAVMAVSGTCRAPADHGRQKGARGSKARGARDHKQVKGRPEARIASVLEHQEGVQGAARGGQGVEGMFKDALVFQSWRQGQAMGGEGEGW